MMGQLMQHVQGGKLQAMLDEVSGLCDGVGAGFRFCTPV